MTPKKSKKSNIIQNSWEGLLGGLLAFWEGLGGQFCLENGQAHRVDGILASPGAQNELRTGFEKVRLGQARLEVKKCPKNRG